MPCVDWEERRGMLCGGYKTERAQIHQGKLHKLDLCYVMTDLERSLSLNLEAIDRVFCCVDLKERQNVLCGDLR